MANRYESIKMSSDAFMNTLKAFNFELPILPVTNAVAGTVDMWVTGLFAVIHISISLLMPW